MSALRLQECNVLCLKSLICNAPGILDPFILGSEGPMTPRLVAALINDEKAAALDGLRLL